METAAAEDFGSLLKRLRGRVSLREVTRRTGVSASYLSQIERGEKRPGANLLRKLADLYRVDPDDLIRRAGHGPQPDPFSDQAMDVERAYRFVLDDPALPRRHPARRSHDGQRQAVHSGDVREIHRQEALGMTTNTLGGFCRDLLDDHEQGVRLDPETVAARFVSWFGVSDTPTLEELTGLAERTGLGTVLEGKQMDGLKGAHIGQPGASTTSTTGTTSGRVPRPRPWPTKSTRSSWRTWASRTPAGRRTPWCACGRNASRCRY